MNPLCETWHINNRIHLYLLNALQEEQLAATATSKGRTVGEQFAHIHNVRLMWLKASMPELMENVTKLEKDNLTKNSLAENLMQSANAIAQLLEKGIETGKIKGFKPHPEAFLGYLIAHESHHRGQITLSLKQSGIQLDKKILFGIWEWGVR